MDKEGVVCVCVCVCVCIHTIYNISIYTMEYYSAIKKNEILPFATWIKLEGIVLSEIGQPERNNCHMISFICGI